MDEAFKNNLKVAICSTSNEAAVTTIARVLLGPERLAKIKIFAGDVVEKKKPAPDVYLLAAKTLNLAPDRCWVVEDSEIGMKAAKAAGMKCIITKSVYTAKEDFNEADVIVDDLDHGLDGPITLTYLNYKASSRAFKTKKGTENTDLFAASPNLTEMFTKIADGEAMGKGMPF
jgi:beta-phosphoglucomutase-like phosphatase (HAD superfamily)